MNFPSITIPSAELGSMTDNLSERIKKQDHCALDTATFIRFGESRNSIPLGRSSLDEVAIEIRTTAASCP
jgi:hypothetical protein